MFHLQTRQPSPRGMLLFVILVLIVLIMVGVFAFTGFLRNRVHYEEQFILQNIGRNLCQSILAYVHSFIQKEVNEKHESSFAQTFKTAIVDTIKNNLSNKDLTPILLADRGFDIEALKSLVEDTENPLKGGEPFKFEPADLKVELSNIRPLFSIEGLSTRDRLAVISIEAAVGFGNRKVRQKMIMQAKIIDVNIPVLSKFTLAVLDLPEGSGEYHYNRCLVTRSGQLSADSPARPLVLDNRTGSGDIEKGGWVFLGSSDMSRIVLRKAGGFGGYGEMFQFYDRNAGHPEPASISARSKPDQDPNINGLFPSSESYLAIVNNYWGFHEDMNIDEAFRKHFDMATSDLAASLSSYLRLYGTEDCRSRTRVIGNVFQCAPYYAVLATVDPATGNGQYPIGMLRCVEKEDYLDGLVDCFVYTDESGNTMKGSALLGWPEHEFHTGRFFCGSYDIYKYFMSDYWTFPYNFNYEYMFYGAGNTGFDPFSINTPKVFLDRHYLIHHDSFRLLSSGGEMLFEGNLTDFSGGKRGLLREVLEKKTVARYRTFSDFLSSTLTGENRRKVPGVAFIEEGPVNFAEDYHFEQSGIIVLENGDIKISAGIPKAGGRPLTIVTLNGNIVVDTSEQICASLVCTRRADSPTSGHFKTTSPVFITGNLVCEILVPDEAKEGGKISYDEGLDPLVPSDMRVYLEDRDMRFNLMEASN